MKRVPFTLINYTVSNHSQINSQINFAFKIIFKLNFRVSTFTKILEAALKKPRYTHEPYSKKQSPSYSPGIPATPKTNVLTSPPTVEHPERHWHTGDTDMDDSDSDESEREHSDDTEVEGTDLGKTERAKPDDTDVKESDSGNKDPYEGEDLDHHITIIPWNDPQNSYKLR